MFTSEQFYLHYYHNTHKMHVHQSSWCWAFSKPRLAHQLRLGIFNQLSCVYILAQCFHHQHTMEPSGAGYSSRRGFEKAWSPNSRARHFIAGMLGLGVTRPGGSIAPPNGYLQISVLYLIKFLNLCKQVQGK